MTRSEAQQRCSELNADPAVEPGLRWMAKETATGAWTAVRVRLPGIPKKIGPLTTSQESRPTGPDPSDPRPLVDPNWGIGF